MSLTYSYMECLLDFDLSLIILRHFCFSLDYLSYSHPFFV